MTIRPQSVLLPALLLGLASMPFHQALGQDKAYTGEMLQAEDLGQLEGDRTLKMTLLTMQPGAEIPEHTHAGPGLRYVLDGAITVYSEDGGEQTYQAGETYFEGPGANHPAGAMSATNAAEGETRVLIVEVAPKQE